MKTLSLLLSIFLSVTTAQSQNTGTITGIVINKETNRPLEAANVLLQGTTIGTSSGQDGSFLLENIPAGEYRLVASFVGYATHRQNFVITAGQTLNLRIALEPSIIPGKPVIVTATLARERETPATFSSLSNEEIQYRYTYQDIPLLLAELPSTTYYSESGNGLGYNYINIRGFDQRRLSVMINGIPQNDPEDHNVYWLDFPDLLANTEDIQVQRGAGSAFYGPPAIGGSVNLVTSSFSAEPKISLEAGRGSYNTERFSLAAHSGIVESKYTFTGKLSRLKTSGYRDQSWSDFSAYYLSAARYDENMTTQINLYGGPFKDHLAYYGIAKSDIKDKANRKANPIVRPEEIENFSQPHYELLHEWRVGENTTLNNTIFLIEGEGFFDFDASWADTTMLRLTGEYGFSPTDNPVNTIVHAVVDNRHWGWLPRLSLDYDRGSATIGAELRVHRSDHYGNIKWAQNLPPEWNDPRTADYRFYEYRGGKDVVSLYVQNLYHLQPNISLMTNVQYVFNRYKLYGEKYLNTEFDYDYHFLNPRVGVNINLTENLNAYANVAHTSREPRLSNLYDATFSWTGERPQFEQVGAWYDFTKPLVKPENLLDIEIGGGYTTANYRLSANLYWMDFRNEIIGNGQLDFFGQPITGNAEHTRHVGLELAGGAQLTEELTFQLNATLSQNTIVKYTTQEDEQGAVIPVSLDGNRIGGFPDLLANARLTYDRETFFASLSMQYVGAYYTDYFENESRKTDAFTVFNFIAGIRVRKVVGLHGIEVRFQVNNMLDELYAAYGVGEEFFPAAERNFFATVKLEL
ncbi:MAG: TonB-dependent receptor [Ignavibacteriae bacterium]|nr:TonB-dependent receptor [Ignavibacteriota bacterium]